LEALQWYDYIRCLTVILTSFSLYRFLRRASKEFETYSERLKDLWLVLCALLFLLAEGTIEDIIYDTEGGPRVALALVVAIISVRATRTSGEPLKYEK